MRNTAILNTLGAIAALSCRLCDPLGRPTGGLSGSAKFSAGGQISSSGAGIDAASAGTPRSNPATLWSFHTTYKAVPRFKTTLYAFSGFYGWPNNQRLNENMSQVSR